MKILQNANGEIVRLVYANKNEYSKEDLAELLKRLKLGEKVGQEDSEPYLQVSASEPLPVEDYKASEFNYILPVDDQTLIYNTLYGSVVVMGPDEFSVYEARDGRGKEELQRVFLSQGLWLRKEMKERVPYLNIAKQIKEYQAKGSIGLTVLPTMKCNARCFYCFEKDSLKEDMTRETADKIIEYVCGKGIRRVNFSWFGGEPMVNYDRMQYLCDSLLIKGIRFSSTMVTNGYLLSSEETIEKLVRVLHIRRVQISLDGLHDTYRMRKNYRNACEDPFSRVIQNIHLLVKYKIRISIRLNIDKNNIKEMEELCRFLGKEFAGEEQIFVYGEFIRDDAYTNKDIYASDEERRMVLERLLPILMDAGLYPDMAVRKFPRIHSCMYDMPNSFVINPDGTICKCENECGEATYQTGSVNSADGWRAAEEKALPEVPHQKECDTCVFFPLCFGGCQHNDKNNLPRCFSDKYFIDIILKNYYKKSKLKEEFSYGVISGREHE